MKAISLLLLAVMVAACSDSITPPPPPPPPNTITVAYCDPYAPLWVAFQDGDGAWTRAQPVVSAGKTEFTHSFTTGRGAIAKVSQGGPGLTSLSILYGTPEDLTTASINSPRFCGAPLKTLHGSVAGLDTNELALIQSGYIAEALVSGGEPFDLPQILPGPRDVLATRLTRTNGINLLSALILRHGIDVPNGATIPVFDFTAPEAVAPVTAHVTLGGTDSAFVTTGFQTSNFLNTFSLPAQAVPGPVQPYLAIPEPRLAAGDLQILRANIHNAGFNGSRSAVLYFRAPTDRELVLGPEAAAPTFTTVARSPSLRISAHFAEQQAYDRMTAITYQEDSTRQVAILQTAGYAALAGVSDLVIPDLSGVDGFSARWALTATPALSWTANRIGGTAGLGLDPVVMDGAIQRAAFVLGTVVP